jgi:hypothetical protein
VVMEFKDIAEIVGPLGVLVVVVAWAIISRRHSGNGYQALNAKLDGVRDDVVEIKTDVRELRGDLVRHLEDHAIK